MVGPEKYDVLSSQLFSLSETVESLAVNPKANEEQKLRFIGLHIRLLEVLGQADQIVIDMGDTEITERTEINAPE